MFAAVICRIDLKKNMVEPSVAVRLTSKRISLTELLARMV